MITHATINAAMAAVMKVQCAESVAAGWTATATAAGAAAASPPPPARFADTLFTALRWVGRLTLIVRFWVTGLSSSPSAIAISAVLSRLPPPVFFAGACFLRIVGASLGRLRRIVFGAPGFSSPLDPSAASREIRDVCRFGSTLPDALAAGGGAVRFGEAPAAGLILIVLGPLDAGTAAAAGAIALSREIFDVSRLDPTVADAFALTRLTPTVADFSSTLFGLMAVGCTATGAVFGSAGAAAFGFACRRIAFSGAGVGFAEGAGAVAKGFAAGRGFAAGAAAKGLAAGRGFAAGAAAKGFAAGRGFAEGAAAAAKGVGVGTGLAAGAGGVAGILIRMVSEVRSLPVFARVAAEVFFGAAGDAATRFRKSSFGGSALSSIGASAIIKLLCSECLTIAILVSERQPQHFAGGGAKLPLSLLLLISRRCRFV